MRGEQQKSVAPELPQQFQVAGAETNPANPILHSIEQTLATTFFKLNRTIEFKKIDDMAFQKQLDNATAIVDALERPVSDLRQCVADEKKNLHDAQQAFDKLSAQSKELNSSITGLRKSLAMREVAQSNLVTKVSDWKQHLVGGSSDRLRDLKRSSEQLMDVIKQAQINLDTPSFASAGPVTQSTDGGGTVTSTVGVTVLSGTGVSTVTPTVRDETVLLSLVEGPSDKEADVKKKADVEKGAEKKKASSFDTVYDSILDMVKEYATADNELGNSVKDQIEEQRPQIPEAAEDNTVHQVVLEQLLQTRFTIGDAIEAQRKAIPDAIAAGDECSRALAIKELEMKAARAAVAAIKKKKMESNEYYLKHILIFKETIEFAKETLRNMEIRAVEKFSGEVASAELRKMKEEIERTLDLCAKLEVVPEKKKAKVITEEGGFIHHVSEQKTVAQASSETTTDEFLAPLPTKLVKKY